MSVNGAAAAARSAANHARATVASADWRSFIARWGLVAKGLLYGSLGLLAIQVARGEAAAHRASQRGAIELVANQPFGLGLLVLLTFGLFALAAWQVILAITGDPVEGGSATDRAVYAGKALLYGATAVTALATLGSYWGETFGTSAGAGGEASQDHATAVVMSWPGGAWLVALVGAAVIAASIYQLRHHTWNRGFMRRLDRGRLHQGVEFAVERAGRVGYAARAVVLMIVGIFFIVAAVRHDPRAAVGLSGALQAAAGHGWGQAILWLVAVGFLAYGAFCFAEARYRRAT